jgi:hypothetical protein
VPTLAVIVTDRFTEAWLFRNVSADDEDAVAERAALGGNVGDGGIECGTPEGSVRRTSGIARGGSRGRIRVVSDLQ